ncbi:hypothetical protein WJX81_004888 [Elliptochloris bilobata]|uniref:Dynamin GTPase n=1 Tax=Elliptochloris bilobata TaxID=381761 RepID=A0AAW1QZQ1_9CHLO
MAPADVVKLDPNELGELLQRLQRKRAAVEKELSRVPGAPKNSKDVFQLCRGFERAFSYTIDSTDYAGYIRRAFTSEGLQGAVQKLPLERNFKLDHVKEVVREADGYQPHLVSPEYGLQRLVDETLALTLEPVSTCVRRVHQVLLDAAREASRKASLLVDTTVVDERREPLKLPAFEAAVMHAATRALERWRDEALEVARTIVCMERSYVTAAFFRHRTYERYRALQQQQQAARLLGEGRAVAADSDSDDEESEGTPPDTRRAGSMGDPAMGGPLSGGLTIPASTDDPGDLKTGYLEKRIGEHSGRQSLPEAWRWQRRYFVLTEPKGALYYFKTADDPPNYKGIVNMRECKAEDVEVDGLPRTAARSKYDLDGGAGAVSLLIRISHKDPSRPCVKNHHSLVLRAETAADKYAWLARLRHASDLVPAPRPHPRGSTDALRAAASGSLDRPSATPSRASNATPRAEDVAAGGMGSTLGFTDDSGLGPEPLLWSSPGAGRPGATARNSRVFDDYLAQLGEDTAAYCRTVCQTIVLTVPKAVVHCQVKRAQAHLLEQLYSYLSAMSGGETEALLEEDPEVSQRRARCKQAVEDLADALAQVKALQEAVEKAHDSRDGAPAAVDVPADVAVLADYSGRRRTGGPPNGGAAENGGRRPSYSGDSPRDLLLRAAGAKPNPIGGAAAPPLRQTSGNGRRPLATPPPRVTIPGLGK